MLTYRRWHRRAGNARSHSCLRLRSYMREGTLCGARLCIRERRRREERERHTRPAGERDVEDARLTPSHTDANGNTNGGNGFFFYSFLLISPRYYVALDPLASNTDFLSSIIEPSWVILNVINVNIHIHILCIYIRWKIFFR